MSADDRRFEVLRAIVSDYVATREPVGSKSLVDRHQLGVSPATIRNDMAVLEDEGYIAQPHTSAGRVPTDKGYRLFVDRLSQVKPMSVGERRAIHSFLSEAVDLDDVLRRAVRSLAQLTRQVAVVQYPTLSRSSVRHVEVVALDPRRLLLVVITDTGRVEQRLVDVGEVADGGDRPATVDHDTVLTLRALLATHVTGRRLADAADGLADLPAQVEPALRPVVRVVVSALLGALVDNPEERLVLSGTSHVTGAWADQPGMLQGVLEAMDEQVTLLKLLTVVQAPDAVHVSIGQENRDDNLARSALVSAGYGSGSTVMGGVAVVGPTRMDYPGTMAAVRAVARYIGEIVSGR
ncbi:heat-inducible transcriptional repressor HrcA [Nakamurella flavida]|uniref:Heat-inducible transcription repressor HrcA n=1 Tax=Nakamurella flavida TaxID=363630 RepID=A0A939C6F2_9ACTN|nr:heat-inducible transcriptional repressor HrcA [Nakamurella flavida]MBM9477137.1 heat-inducible transcriptional repressor HrcA [Nakamurella flavida]MDP9780084.1 heat-inducible transcriptional repressor [Nakamurella flavida]